MVTAHQPFQGRSATVRSPNGPEKMVLSVSLVFARLWTARVIQRISSTMTKIENSHIEQSHAIVELSNKLSSTNIINFLQKN